MVKTIDLINRNNSDIGYTISNFPDGHTHIKLERGFNKYNEVNIKCRITDYDDMFILKQIGAILEKERIVVKNIHIYYLLAARMDRQMSLEESCDLKIILNDIYDSILYCPKANIHLYDIHSYNVTENFANIKYNSVVDLIPNIDNYLICFPDKGANERFTNCPEILWGADKLRMNIEKNPPILCDKVRDPETNKLSHFQILNDDYYKQRFEKGKFTTENPILVVDDLCDGGGTFVGIAELLRTYEPTELSLFVTHAIQREGIERVAKVYDKVYITNSFYNWEKYENNGLYNEPLILPENVEIINIL